MTDKIQDPFEDFPETEGSWSEHGGQILLEKIYPEHRIKEWRSKHEIEIKRNIKIVERVKEVYNQNKANTQLYYLTGFDLLRILGRMLDVDEGKAL